MKQLTKTPEIIELLQKAVGSGVSVNALAVYEAGAFNTLPTRKRHPLYKDARANRALLEEMAARLSDESLPVHIMHNSDVLPIGRVFHAKVVDLGDRSELRVLFFVDTTDEVTRDIDLGIVDQVSVSILSKQVLCSACGFDFLGDEADFEHIWSGTCDKGHVLGEDGVHARLIGLEEWFEMSLVGRGGARQARIIPSDQSVFGSQSMQRLAANGVDPNVLVLSASPEKGKIMELDLSAHIKAMADLQVDLAGKTTALEAANTRIAELTAQVTELTAQVEAASTGEDPRDARIAELTSAQESLTGDRDAAVAALTDVARTLLTMTGQVDGDVPTGLAALSALISEKQAALKGLLVAGGTARDAIAGGASAATPVVSRAFKTTKR